MNRMNEKAHILIIDDDEGAQISLKLILQKKGYQADTAGTGSEALQKAKAGSFNLALVDIKLPEIEGIELIAPLKEIQPDIEIIMATGFASKETAIRALNAGAFGYVTKPLNLDELLVLINNALEKQRLAVEKRQSDEAIRESNLFNEWLLNTIPFPLDIVDANGHVLFMNPTMETAVGKDALGKQCWTVYRDDKTQCVDCPLKRDIAIGETSVIESSGVLGGRIFEISHTGMLYQGEKALMEVFYDITNRKRAEEQIQESERKYRSLFENAPIGVYQTALDGRILTANPALVHILGYDSADELRSIPVSEFYVDKKEREAFVDAFQESDQVHNLEIWLKRKDGQEIAGLDNAIAIRDEDGKVLYYEGTLTDITERKQKDLELSRRTEQVELLYDAGKELGRTLDLGTIYQNLHSIVSKVMPCNGMVLSTFDPNDNLIRCVSFWSEETSLDVSDFPAIPLNLEGEGTQSRVIISGQSLYLADYLATKQTGNTSYYVNEEGIHEEVPAGEEDITRSALIVPIMQENQVGGVIQVFSNQKDGYNEENLRFLEALSPQVAAGMSNALLHEKTERALQNMQALRNIDKAISGSFDLSIILSVILDAIIVQLEVDAVDVLLFNRKTQTLEYCAGRGFRTVALQHTQLQMGQSHAGSAVLERRIVHIADLNQQDTGFLVSPELKSESFVAYYGAPLIAKGQVVGVMEIFHRAPLSSAPEWLEILDTLAGQAAIAIENSSIFTDLQRSNMETKLAYEKTLEGWGRALEYRNMETKGHSQRVVDWTMQIAKSMGIRGEELTHIRRGALLHDIGKMGIPDSILQKPGPLSEEEWAIMRQHPTFAYEMLLPIDHLRPALDIPYYHHERWDGTGYPHGLKGAAIPLAARIFAIVDVWDALSSDRPYREAWPREKIISHIREQSGKHFDPQVVEVFLDLANIEGGS